MGSIVKYSTDTGVEVALDFRTVRDYLVDPTVRQKVTDREVVLFMELCKAQRLNPFLREAYLVKYGDNPATLITGKETFTKRAFRNPDFDGYEAGVAVERDGSVTYREGSLKLDGEKLVAGWAKVYTKNRSHPFYAEASFSEYNTGQAQWKSKPATMIRKVALVSALREAFPEDFAGLYDAAEMGVDENGLSDTPVIIEATVEGTDASLGALVGVYMEESGWSRQQVATEMQNRLGFALMEITGDPDKEAAALDQIKMMISELHPEVPVYEEADEDIVF